MDQPYLTSPKNEPLLISPCNNDPNEDYYPLDGFTISKFPSKLYQMLQDSDKYGFQSIVSWLPDGKGFVVRNSRVFIEKIARDYFSQTKFKSFQRQLNLYGFQMIHQGYDKGTKTVLWKKALDVKL